MSETLAASPKTSFVYDDASDLLMLAQVERWMATIRELCRDQAESTFCAGLRPAARAVTE